MKNKPNSSFFSAKVSNAPHESYTFSLTKLVIVFEPKTFEGLFKITSLCPFKITKTGMVDNDVWIFFVFLRKKLEELILFKNPSKYFESG